MTKKKIIYEEINIDKLVHGGQGLGLLPDGRKVFVWNSLPGERVKARITRSKKDFAEAIAEEIIEASPDRIDPVESIYLATSPWQIINFDAENNYKSKILEESFAREGQDVGSVTMITDGKSLGYRNKIEFSFYGDDDGVHFAFYNRGTHQKQIVEGSALALDPINTASTNILAELNKIGVRAGDLKSLILRCNQEGSVTAALFVKTKMFTKLEHLEGIQGLKVYYSNPKSPASVATKLIYTVGSTELTDELLGKKLSYDVVGFFQVNIPVFQMVLGAIDRHTESFKDKVDLYSGVGSIGIPLNGTSVLVELDPSNVKMAMRNAEDTDIKVIHASTEQALEYIKPDGCVIVDPPRSGLHKDVIGHILDVKPAMVCYLSCNPSTQARDVAMLAKEYELSLIEGYNFFPRTPHIESLCILVKK